MSATTWSVAIAIAVGVTLTGCADGGKKKPDPTWEEAAATPLISANYRAAEALLKGTQVALDKGRPLLVATVVSIDALDQSSTLGRLISEHVAARFSQQGYQMIEMKFRNSVYVKRSQGELMLTREIDQLAKTYDAPAVIVGSYGMSDDMVFVNLKVIQPSTNIVLAAHDYALPLDSSVKALIRAR